MGILSSIFSSVATSPGFPNAPQRLSMQDFRSVSDRYQGLAKSCRYLVVIRPNGKLNIQYGGFARDLTYLCESGEIPGRSFMNMDVKYYGPNQKLPFQVQYEDMNLTFLCRTQSLERRFFDDWMSLINPIDTWNFNYREDYQCDIDIYQYGESPNFTQSIVGAFLPEILGPQFSAQPQYWITVHNAYPLNLYLQQSTWTDDQFQRLVTTFTYTHWSRKNLDVPSRPQIWQNGYTPDVIESGSTGASNRTDIPIADADVYSVDSENITADSQL